MKLNVKRYSIFFFVGLISITVVYSLSRDKPIEVLLHTIEPGIVESTVSNTRAGTVKACRRARMSPASAGQIATLTVKEGDKVKQGQEILALWNDDVVAQLDLAKREAEASKEVANQTCLLAESAEREAKRLLALQAENLASDELVDKAVTVAKSSHAGCNAAQARTKVSDARVHAAKAALERTKLRAPFDGYIAEINGEVGEFLTPSPAGIVTLPAVDLVDTSCLYISAPIDEVDAPRIVEGMEARITLDAFSKQNFLGAVRRVAPYVLEIEKQARTVEVEAIFMDENQYSQLMPGYSADLEVILDAKHDVLRIPSEAILENNYVLLFGAFTSTLEKRKIETGISNWKYTEVISGLEKGDEILLSIDRKGAVDGAYVKPE